MQSVPKGTHSEECVKVFLLTENELKKIRGTHGFGSWKMACTGCGRELAEADIGSTVVSIRTKRHPFPKEFYHSKCFNERSHERVPRNEVKSK